MQSACVGICLLHKISQPSIGLRYSIHTVPTTTYCTQGYTTELHCDCMAVVLWHSSAISRCCVVCVTVKAQGTHS